MPISLSNTAINPVLIIVYDALLNYSNLEFARRLRLISSLDWMGFDSLSSSLIYQRRSSCWPLLVC
jgi:hypothetical protein